MPAFGNFTVGACYNGIIEAAAGRQFPNASMAEWVRKAVLELSEDYDFQGLQATGPLVNLTPNQSQYTPDYFLSTGDVGANVNKIKSIFMYYDPTLTPTTINPSNTNTGINLAYRDIGTVENTRNISSIPSYWSRWAGQIFIAPAPNLPYLAFARYQKQHPFPNKGTPNAGTDTIYLDDSWQDIVEYSAAHRGAVSTRLYDIATGLHNMLYGDPKWQISGGTKGQPGLIFRRVSQYERDSVTATRSLQLRRY